MSHGLLLRLFLSPSFFTVHVALQYLGLYSDNIGITYYITRRLRELDIQELKDVWGFLCHLLITKPSKSRALECFVVEISQRSTHIAMITLWFMQAALKDLVRGHNNSPNFMICQRVLHSCHEIIFGDLPSPIAAPYSSLLMPFQSRFGRKRIKHHAEPVFVGIGLLLAGVPSMPHLTQIMGEVALEQGRADDHEGRLRSLESHEDDTVPAASPSISSASLVHEADVPHDIDEIAHREAPSRSTPDLSLVLPGTSIASTPKHSVQGSQTAPALPLYLRVRRSRNSEDPLGQLDGDLEIASPYQSSPTIPSARPPLRSASINLADTLLQNYDLPSQVHLLRSHYCRSEVQFILSLENISNRLLVIPKPARVSALRAELTALNHKLPAEVCMPMWCSSSDTARISSSDSNLIPQPHHRIVRVPPGESVVLNSAERAPYLLFVEILSDDLDFDPSKRANKEVLKKIVVKEYQQKGGSKDLIPFSARELPSRHRVRESINDADVAGYGPVFSDPASYVVPPVTPPSVTTSDDEEMDLVEQLFGPEQSLRSTPVDLTDSIVLPPAPKNKELDMVAWSSSIPPTPNVDNSEARMSSSLSFGPDFSRGQFLTASPPEQKESGLKNSIPYISLDEYSERMRTAAIMLAQLNANQLREFPNQDAQSNGPISWIPGSSWLSSDSSNRTNTSQKSSETFHGSMRLQPAAAAEIRERIMQEMLALEEERMERMREHSDNGAYAQLDVRSGMKTAEDEGIIRRELDKADPSAAVFTESWAAKKSRIRHASPYGHLANWDCVSVIVKTGGDLRQEQLAVQLIQQFQRIWAEENCQCWVRYFRILITGGSSGLVETITDAVSIHSIKKAEYARRLVTGQLGHVTLYDHFKSTYGDPSSAKFVRAQKNFAKSLAGYSVVTYLLQIKDRHNGNILLDREGHLIHIDFGFILSNTPGNIGFEAAPFKLPPEYIDVLGGIQGLAFLEFKKLFREGFEAARKHCDTIITLIELMQKDSSMPCFALTGEQTANHLRERFQPALNHSLVGDHIDRLIESSLGSNWTRLYDSYQYYSQSIF